MPDAYLEIFTDPIYAPLHLVTLFVLGAALGSFLNVCIYRIPHGVSLSRPGSHCYRCGRAVRWFDNIPLLSYWLLRGRCRHCGAKFSMRYFMIELLTALLFVGAALRLGPSLALLPALIFICLLIVATFTDIDHWIIPDRITLGGLGVGLALAAIWPVGWAAGNPLAASGWGGVPIKLMPLVSSAGGAVLGFLLLFGIGWFGSLIFRKEAMGFGDVKLFAMFGAFLGVAYMLHVLVLASLIGSLVGLAGLIASRWQRRRPAHPAVAPLAAATPEEAGRLAALQPLSLGEQEILRAAAEHPGAVGTIRHHLPFGPSLALAALVVYFFGREMIDLAYRWMM